MIPQRAEAAVKETEIFGEMSPKRMKSFQSEEMQMPIWDQCGKEIAESCDWNIFCREMFLTCSFFNAFSMPNVRGTFQSSVCFLYTSSVRRVTRGSARWEWLWNWVQSWSELGRPCFSVGTCIHVNYLLVVQQEMRNDNKLGKEKQNNKQMVSHPLTPPPPVFPFCLFFSLHFLYLIYFMCSVGMQMKNPNRKCLSLK